MDEASSRGPVAVLIGSDVTAAQMILRGMSAEAPCSVIVALDAANTAPSIRGTSVLPVADATNGARLQPGHVYIVPPRTQATVLGGSLVIEGPNGPGVIDRFLRSVADQFARDATVVVLGGHNGDGTLGLKSVREAGGLTICQRVENGPLAELPRAAVMTGLVDLVLPVNEIAARLVRNRDEATVLGETTRPDDTLRDILTMIRIRTGHDFSWYKRATLYRRLSRRMQICQTQTVADYYRLLREHPSELSNLLRDFLISVTNFFRDAESWEALEQTALPRMFRNKTGGDQVRVWCAGCATGEEAYSLGMLLSEYAARLPDPPQLQIFATDIDEEALQEARQGSYPEQISTDVSAERLERFFIRENGGYRVCKELREMMLFSPHNVLRDPPFSRLDLVSCRNLLIYLNRDAQERVINTFHFALRNEGLLFLGSSESAESMQQFSAVDSKNRIFERRIAPTGIATDTLVAPAHRLPARAPFPLPSGERPTIGSFGELHHRAVELYGPPSVLVNEDLDIVHLSEHASRFLSLAGGEPTRQILRMVHPALRFELRGAIYAARQPERGGDTRVVRYMDQGQQHAIEIRVRSVDFQEAGRGTMLVMFDEVEVPREVAAAADKPGEHIEPVIREMEEELHRTREQLRTTVEQYETSVEELKASNEELQAINEELRSATEELETSKEELQSVNEELTTLNHELKVKVDEVSRANSDLQNLMTSTDIGVLFLDRQLNIKRFTPRIQDLFNIIPSDVGRPVAHLTNRLDYDDLHKAAAQVLLDLRTTDREVKSTDGRRFLARLLPYRSIEDRIDGVVVTFVDISDLTAAREAHSRSEAARRAIEERLSAALAGAPLAIITHDKGPKATWGFVDGKQVPPENSHTIFADSDRYLDIVKTVCESGESQRVELDVAVVAGTRTYDFRIQPRREDGKVIGVTSVGFDITPSKFAERALRDSDRRKDEFLAILAHELRNPITPLRVAFDVARLGRTDPKQLDESFKVIDRQLQHIVRLVDDLLDVARIGEGKFHLVKTAIDPVRIIEAALETTRPLIDEHKHTLRVELPQDRATVVGDFGRLAQALTNLLTNAAKFTADGGQLTLRAKLDDPRHVFAISVSDNGVGIAPEMLGGIFELFAQGKEDGGEEGGLGVGLNLAQRIAKVHGGQIVATSDGLGKGSTFTLEIPLEDGSAGSDRR